MKIEKVLLNGIELTKEKAQNLYNKYVKDYMTRECFFGGILIHTPEGKLQAIVKYE